MGASKSSVQYQARTHAGWPKSGTSPKTSLFTADELLGMGRHLNPGWDDPLARRRLTDLGLPLDKPVGLLSGGERAQVALALALGKHPRLLLLDEPVASLDPLARRDFLASLAAASAESDLTVVLSSHLVADIERVCDYLIILASSQVQPCGEVEEILARRIRTSSTTKGAWTP
jgi:ABC-2 type transport system ATP-binding protein